MSELTSCNYCSFKQIKKRVKEVKLVDSKKMPGWKAAEVKGKEVAWFMKMTDHCVC